MESNTKEIMDGLFQGNLAISEASEKLGISEDEIHNIIDDYEYVPTAAQVNEIGNVIKENMDYIENNIISPHKMRGVSFDKPITTDGLPDIQIGATYRTVPTDANGMPYQENNPYHR